MVKIGVFGATGAVGGQMIAMLENCSFKLGGLRLFARGFDLQRHRNFRGTKIVVEDLATADLRGIDIALVSIGSKPIKEFLPEILKHGTIVIDNSSAYRMHSEVPLIVPEINGSKVAEHKGVIANPNCTTAITLMALYPLHRRFGAQRVSVTSYQAASGAGKKGLKELQTEVVAYCNETMPRDGKWNQKMHTDVFPHPIAFNVFPHIGSFAGSSTDEELKVLNESRKIMEHPDLQVSTTCVRVPVERVHCMDVLVQCKRKVVLTDAIEALKTMPGLDVFEGNDVPTPLQYAGKSNCAVARIRIDSAFDNALRFWVLGDQLLKGAALNAVQIAELLAK